MVHKIDNTRLNGKKLTLSFIAHELIDGQCPPTSTSRPPDVIHVIGVPRPSPFSCSSASMYYTEQKLKNKKWGRAWERGYRALAAQARDSEFK